MFSTHHFETWTRACLTKSDKTLFKLQKHEKGACTTDSQKTDVVDELSTLHISICTCTEYSSTRSIQYEIIHRNDVFEIVFQLSLPRSFSTLHHFAEYISFVMTFPRACRADDCGLGSEG